MIKGKALIEGGSVYIEDIDTTFKAQTLKDMSLTEFKQICGFATEKELDKILNWLGADENGIKTSYILSIYDRL